jgi:hypothetical protein
MSKTMMSNAPELAIERANRKVTPHPRLPVAVAELHDVDSLSLRKAIWLDHNRGGGEWRKMTDSQTTNLSIRPAPPNIS